jgi:hypothetical protein
LVVETATRTAAWVSIAGAVGTVLGATIAQGVAIEYEVLE